MLNKVDEKAMDIFRTTHREKEVNREIEDIVGKSFSLMDRIRMGGVGSARMVIHSVSQNLNSLLPEGDELPKGNLELRPEGIIVLFNKGLETYSWPIPFYHLSIFKTDKLSIHAQGNFVKFLKPDSLNKKFVQKVLEVKQRYESAFPRI
ncbi:MAG TPA: hypothetical protein DDX92_07270 [Flavobacteriales bacterium]|nr:hypothetical protein [Flavobacteriales bacterium]